MPKHLCLSAVTHVNQNSAVSSPGSQNGSLNRNVSGLIGQLLAWPGFCFRLWWQLSTMLYFIQHSHREEKWGWIMSKSVCWSPGGKRATEASAGSSRPSRRDELFKPLWPRRLWRLLQAAARPRPFVAKDDKSSFTFLANVTFLFLPEIYMYALEILQPGK